MIRLVALKPDNQYSFDHLLIYVSILTAVLLLFRYFMFVSILRLETKISVSCTPVHFC